MNVFIIIKIILKFLITKYDIQIIIETNKELLPCNFDDSASFNNIRKMVKIKNIFTINL